LAIASLSRAPLVGNLLEFRRDRLALFARLRAECGDLGAFHLGPRRLVVVSSPELAHEVLVAQADAFEKGPTLRRFARPLLGDGLLSVDNARHRRNRRLVAPAFTPRTIAHHVALMADEAERSAARLLAAGAAGRVVDLADECTQLTLAIIGRSLFSFDLSQDAAAARAALETVQRHIDGILRGFVPLPAWLPTRANRTLARALGQLDALIGRLVAERRRGGPKDAPDDLLSALVFSRDADGEFLDDRQIRDEAMTLFVAGHETTAFALAWTFHLLLDHPDVGGELDRELETVLGGRAPGWDDLPKLPYTLQVLSEAMRLYPPGHTPGRVAARDVILGGERLPKGTLVLVSIWLLHRRADLWPEPERFMPARFVDERALPRHAYLPFSAGPRNCIGARLALAEMQIALAVLRQRTRLSRASAAPVEPEMLVTLRPRGGLPVRVSRYGV
jgi:cytochrome P450